jgi:hypothetical protein
MTFSVELVGLGKMQAVIQGAGRSIDGNVGKAVEVTSRHIKDDAKRNAADVLGEHVRHQPSTYQYEMVRPQKGIVEGWVGPVKGWKQAAIPLEYGTPFTAPKPALEPALEANVEDFIKGITMAVGESL